MSSESSTRSVAWYKTPIERTALQDLHRRSNLKAFLQVGGHIGLVGILACAACHFQSRPFLLFPILFVYGTIYVFLLNATHELSHNSVFQTRWLNAFFLRCFCFLGWRNHIIFWTSHAEHHKYTLHPPEDLEVVLPTKISLANFVRVLLPDPQAFFATVRRTIQHSCGQLDGEWESYLFPEVATAKRRQLTSWARFLLLGHATLIGLSVYFGLWLLPLLTTFGAFYSGWLRWLCNNTQHAGLTDDVPDFRLCTRTVLLNPVVRFLYWHMNYHIEHHMYAAVPCYNLGKLHALIEHDLPYCHSGLLSVWREIIATIKRQRVEPDYQFLPQLPPASST